MKPKLSQLRESGSIEQDADMVGLLYETKESEPLEDGQLIDLLIAKQRSGERYVTVHFTFLRSFTRFKLAPRIDSMDLPDAKSSRKKAI